MNVHALPFMIELGLGCDCIVVLLRKADRTKPATLGPVFWRRNEVERARPVDIKTGDQLLQRHATDTTNVGI